MAAVQLDGRGAPSSSEVEAFARSMTARPRVVGIFQPGAEVATDPTAEAFFRRQRDGDEDGPFA